MVFGGEARAGNSSFPPARLLHLGCPRGAVPALLPPVQLLGCTPRFAVCPTAAAAPRWAEGPGGPRVLRCDVQVSCLSGDLGASPDGTRLGSPPCCWLGGRRPPWPPASREQSRILRVCGDPLSPPHGRGFLFCSGGDEGGNPCPPHVGGTSTRPGAPRVRVRRARWRGAGGRRPGLRGPRASSFAV